MADETILEQDVLTAVNIANPAEWFFGVERLGFTTPHQISLAEIGVALVDPVDADITALDARLDAAEAQLLTLVTVPADITALDARITVLEGISADPIVVVGDVSLLAATVPFDGQLYQTLGYWAAGDDGGNVYRYDSLAVDAIDGGWVIDGPGSVGRFLAIERQIANVKQFGAQGDGIVNDSVPIQAAIDSAQAALAATVYFPASAAFYRCNVLVNPSVGVTLRGEGNKSVLWSANPGQFAMTIEGGFHVRQNRIANLDFWGDGQASDGLYINAQTNVALRDCSFISCGIGLCFNGTVVDQLENCNFELNYVGLYLTSVVGANTTITDIAGRTVTLTDRMLAAHSGAQSMTNCRMQQNICAIFVEQPDVSFAKDNGIFIAGGLIEASGVGIFMPDNSRQWGQPMTITGVWFEANTFGVPIVNGYSSPNADINASDGKIVCLGGAPTKCIISGSAVIEYKGSTFNSATSVTVSDAGTAIADEVLGEGANLWDLFGTSVRQGTTGTNRASAINTAHKTRLSRGWEDKVRYSRTCLPGSLMTAYGGATLTTVADGLFEQKACLQVTATAANTGCRTDGVTHSEDENGLITFGIKGVFAAPAPVTVDDTTDTFTAVGHGFANHGKVSFATDTTLPAPLVAGKEYWVIGVATDSFQVSLTRGGATLDITDTGTGTHTVERTMFELQLNNLGAGSLLTPRLFPVTAHWRTYAISAIAAAGAEGDFIIWTPAGDLAETWRISGIQVLVFDAMKESVEFQHANLFALSPTETTYSTGSGSPLGVLTPVFIGQKYLDTAGGAWYAATGLTNTEWEGQAANSTRVVTNVAALATAVPKDEQLFQTRGYTTASDGGANLYRYDATSVATVDGGWVIDGPASVGRYLALDRRVANVLQFGAIANSVTDCSAAVQAAIDAAETIIGSTVYFPAVTSSYRCNVTVDATKGLTIAGEGNKSMLWSFGAGLWAMQIEGINYARQTTVKNIDFFGDLQANDGLYINGTSNFSVRDCTFTSCGIGLCFNSTIKNQIENCVFSLNYVGLFLTSATGANTDIASINGRNVQITNRVSATQPGSQYITNFNFNQNRCGIYIEQPDVVAASRLNGTQLVAGTIEGNDIGIWVKEGSVQWGGPMVASGVWYESNDGPAVTIRGVSSSAAADLELTGGSVVTVGSRHQRLVASGDAILRCYGATFDSASFVTLSGTASVTADDVIGEQSSLWDLFATSVRQGETGTNRASAVNTPHKTKLSRGYEANVLYSRTLLPGSLMTSYGSDTRTTVADGLFEQRASMQVSPATNDHGVQTTGIATTTNQIGLITMGVKGIFAAAAAVTVDAGTDTFTATAHGFADNGKVIFATDTTLPAPLVAGREYWLIAVAANTFQVSLTRGGTALDITDTGTGSHTVERVAYELQLLNVGTGAFITARFFPVRAHWRTYAIVGLAAAGGEGDVIIRAPLAGHTWRMSGFQALTFETMHECVEFQKSNVFAMDAAETLYSTGAGTPVGALVPTFIGQDYFDTTGTVWYKSVGLTNADWQAL